MLRPLLYQQTASRRKGFLLGANNDGLSAICVVNIFRKMEPLLRWRHSSSLDARKVRSQLGEAGYIFFHAMLLNVAYA
ncbi:hypothetical protein HF313_16490 [Massilia atriviolacea]|uniref:Uncharacterized protein n=1 Tax=Massilia atriviolacea TaxID=2495579 RepID=A0A430HUE4_9BURK|nr:hypothetical protein [Massilia atriviolacea]RSZ61092.1 hypothetical protein EJB06_02905 [Massilia atriviolacea]